MAMAKVLSEIVILLACTSTYGCVVQIQKLGSTKSDICSLESADVRCQVNMSMQTRSHRLASTATYGSLIRTQQGSTRTWHTQLLHEAHAMWSNSTCSVF
jgi:ribosomal protein RSM22 (predicted rRNA methylase)